MVTCVGIEHLRSPPLHIWSQHVEPYPISQSELWTTSTDDVDLIRFASTDGGRSRSGTTSSPYHLAGIDQMTSQSSPSVPGAPPGGSRLVQVVRRRWVCSPLAPKAPKVIASSTS